MHRMRMLREGNGRINHLPPPRILQPTHSITHTRYLSPLSKQLIHPTRTVSSTKQSRLRKQWLTFSFFSITSRHHLPTFIQPVTLSQRSTTLAISTARHPLFSSPPGRHEPQASLHRLCLSKASENIDTTQNRSRVTISPDPTRSHLARSHRQTFFFSDRSIARPPPDTRLTTSFRQSQYSS